MKKKHKKVKKLNYKNIVIVIILSIFVIVSACQFNKYMAVRRKGYSVKSSIKINKLGIKSEVLDKDYSQLVDELVHDNNLVIENLDKYYLIDYYAQESFGINVNKLLEMKYTPEQINIINKKNDNKLVEVLKNRYISDIEKYIEYDFFKLDKLDRYISYNKGDYKDAVIKVNIGLDKEFYTDPNIVSEYSTTMLVNTYNKLDENFVPELVKMDKCSEGENYLSKEAKEAFDKMCDASTEAGLHLGTTSSYRSYKDQQDVYNYYLKVNGQDYVNKYVAKPGFSEHQTGLALDVKSVYASPFKTTKEYTWMINNSYKYGFILRYPDNTKDITGYNSESWHFRYVGVEIATYIHENNLTYDEYFAIFM